MDDVPVWSMHAAGVCCAGCNRSCRGDWPNSRPPPPSNGGFGFQELLQHGVPLVRLDAGGQCVHAHHDNDLGSLAQLASFCTKDTYFGLLFRFFGKIYNYDCNN